MNNNLVDKIISNFLDEYNNVPQKTELYKWCNELILILFPNVKLNREEIQNLIKINKNDLKQVLLQTGNNENSADNLTETFYNELQVLHSALLEDANEFINKDPAAKCLGEVIHTYPGFFAIAVYRIANTIFRKLKIPYIPRMLTEYAHSKTGIDIHPAASIDVPFIIDHGTGVVIGETCVIGKYVNIYQGVTLGAIQVNKDLQNTKRHPTIEDHVVIYANTTILGGNTIIGNNSVIGGNVFLTKSIDPYTLIFNKSTSIIKKIKSNNEIINFVI